MQKLNYCYILWGGILIDWISSRDDMKLRDGKMFFAPQTATAGCCGRLTARSWVSRSGRWAGGSHRESAGTGGRRPPAVASQAA